MRDSSGSGEGKWYEGNGGEMNGKGYRMRKR